MPIFVVYVTSAMLFIGAAPLPYGYYTLLRLVAMVVFIWAAIVVRERGHQVLPWVFAVLALLFNPIIKIYLPKEVWAVIDLACGVLLLAASRFVVEEIRPEAIEE